ncbi:hypothetical protein BC829DRAFT_440054 [Chytridium lagenaria]|nr:hypothetical protein BC829DRAFT_440054 [Chytridium lagenaria]
MPNYKDPIKGSETDLSCYMPLNFTSSKQFVDTLKEEFRPSVPTLVDSNSNVPLDPSAVPLRDLFNGNMKIVLGRTKAIPNDGYEIHVDRNSLTDVVQKETAIIRDLSHTVEKSQNLNLSIERSVDLRFRIFRFIGLSYVSAQAGVIIYYTNVLGWDVMEPVAYIVSLTNITLGGAIFFFLRTEPSPGRIAEWFQDWCRKRLHRKYGYDHTQEETVKAQILHHEALLKPLKIVS